MKKSVLKVKSSIITQTVDSLTGELLHEEKIKQTYIANANEQFYFVFSTLMSIFQKISYAEIRVYAYLMLHYPSDTVIVINEIIRKKIESATELRPGTINNTMGLLSSVETREHPLLYKLGKGTYQINPRYAYQGSTALRNNSLKKIIESGCKYC